jgi:precorrin-6A synthase
MKRKILVIGIGAGNPEHVTIQAVEAMNRASVLFIPDKGAAKQQLTRVRKEICERFIRTSSWRMVEFDVPSRRQAAHGYRGAVADWRDDVASVYERLLMEELADEQWGAFLVWGDPSLYDGTTSILERLRARGRFELDYEVIPGISSVQALAARHRIPLNDIGQSILITTGRKLAEGLPDGAESVVVMLDSDRGLRSVDGDLDVFWGAYVGMPEEVLVSGKLRGVIDDIERLREAARAKNGWIMDSYLLRRGKRD